MSENVPVEQNMVFVIDTALTLIYFTYEPRRNVFKGNGEKVDISAMRKLHAWIGERLI
jgi:hypothetical protein